MTDLAPPIEFEIPGEAVGTKYKWEFGRPRKNDKSTAYKALVRTIAKLNRPPEPWPGAVEVTISFFMEPPKSWSARRRKRALDGEIYCTNRPDTTNVQKLIEDAMSKVIYCDDKQVVDNHTMKFWGSPARAVVRVRPLEYAPTQPSLL